MQLECARTIAEVAQVIINTAKVELDVMRAVGGTRGTGFIEMPAQDAEPATPRLVKGAAQSGGG